MPLEFSVQTGRDGCVCKFVLETGSQLICTGVENLTSITVVESLECCGGGNRRVAAGFIASDFVLWDLSHQSEVHGLLLPKLIFFVLGVSL
jgi:hypothetical protein